jgi:hypothetical protein
MDDEPTPFTLPLPPPGDVLFFRHEMKSAPPLPEEGRETEDIMLRSVPRATAQRFRAAAGGRGLTHAQYLAALVQLHEALRHRADGGDAEVGAELERLGLSTVSI